jgi:hypothetical protein
MNSIERVSAEHYFRKLNQEIFSLKVYGCGTPQFYYVAWTELVLSPETECLQAVSIHLIYQRLPCPYAVSLVRLAAFRLIEAGSNVPPTAECEWICWGTDIFDTCGVLG